MNSSYPMARPYPYITVLLLKMPRKFIDQIYLDTFTVYIPFHNAAMYMEIVDG